jgi:FeS assembly SUF system regulator
MLKLGRLTDYATVIMTALALQPEGVKSAHDLAADTRVAEPTVCKVLKLLAKSGLVDSLRGAHGGYRLARPASQITVADVVSAIEGPIGLTECSVHGDCSIEPHCAVRGNWQLISRAIRVALEAVTLEQMAKPPQRPAEAPIRFAEMR